MSSSFSTAFSPTSILPLMHDMPLAAAAVIFRSGDPSEAVYLVGEGLVEIPELDIWLGIVYRLECKDLASALVQHPRMGVHLFRLITRAHAERKFRHTGDTAGARPDRQHSGLTDLEV